MPQPICFVTQCHQGAARCYFFVGGHRRAASMSAGNNKASKMINTADLRDHKCTRPNIVGKDEDYCCQRCVNIL